MIIDAHTHVTHDGHWSNSTHDASIETLLHKMDEAGIEKSVVLPIATLTTTEYVHEQCQKYPDRLIGMASIGLSTWKEDIQTAINLGAIGVKFHPRIQNESLIALEATGALAELEKQNLIFVTCSWPQSSASNVCMEEITPLLIDKFAKKYPNLRLIYPHMGAHNMWETSFCIRANKNVYTDTSYFTQYFKNTTLMQDFKEVLIKCDEKIFFGTDFPEVCPVKDVADFLAIDISKEKQENILYKNYQRMMRE